MKGEAAKQSSLTASDIPIIRNAHINGTTITSLAKTYNLTRAAIRAIVNRKSWKHII